MISAHVEISITVILKMLMHSFSFQLALTPTARLLHVPVTPCAFTLAHNIYTHTSTNDCYKMHSSPVAVITGFGLATISVNSI